MSNEKERAGPTGVGVPGPRLAAEAKEQLRIIATPKAAPTGDVEAFLGLIDLAASMYWASRDLQTQALPAAVRREVKAAHRAFLKLVKQINALGGKSRQLLYGLEGSGAAEFHDALTLLGQRLSQAHARADALSKSGGPSLNYARTHLAAVVAHAIETRLGVKPTSTSFGLFEEVLKTVLEAVEKREDPHVRELMRRALKARVHETAEGGIEVDPWVG